MPRISQQITGQVPLEKTVGPTVGAGFLTDTARAIAQSGSALGQQLGNLITELKEIEDDTKIRKANVALSTQGIELRNRFTDPVQVAERYGEGKKDHSALASDWSSEWDKAVEGISGNLKGISARRMDQWRAGIAMEKNQEGLTINRFQVGIIRDRAARAFYEGHESINNEFDQGKIVTAEEAIAEHDAHWAQGIASGVIQDTPANAKARDSYIDEVDRITAARAKASEIDQAKVFADGVIGSGASDSDMLLAVATSNLNEAQKKLASAQVNRFITAKEAKAEEDQRESTTIAAQAALNGIVPEGFDTIEDFLGERVATGQMTPTQSDTWLDNYYANMARKAKGKPIVPNHIIRGEIDDDINDVGRRTQTFDEATEKIYLAYYGQLNKKGQREYVYGDTISKTPLINDGQYVKAISDVGNVFDKQTEDAVRIRNAEARELLLGVAIASLDLTDPTQLRQARAIAAGRGETEKHLDIRAEFVADYKDEMREWVELNSDRIKKEGIGMFYKHAARRKQDYRKDALQAIADDKATTRAGGVAIEELFVPFRPKNRKEFDLIPFGSPIELPNGKTGIK